MMLGSCVSVYLADGIQNNGCLQRGPCYLWSLGIRKIQLKANPL